MLMLRKKVANRPSCHSGEVRNTSGTGAEIQFSWLVGSEEAPCSRTGLLLKKKPF
jgi:hypothetical protein